jgi:hypothetical protein
MSTAQLGTADPGAQSDAKRGAERGAARFRGRPVSLCLAPVDLNWSQSLSH